MLNNHFAILYLIIGFIIDFDKINTILPIGSFDLSDTWEYF